MEDLRWMLLPQLKMAIFSSLLCRCHPLEQGLSAFQMLPTVLNKGGVGDWGRRRMVTMVDKGVKGKCTTKATKTRAHTTRHHCVGFCLWRSSGIGSQKNLASWGCFLRQGWRCWSLVFSLTPASSDCLGELDSEGAKPQPSAPSVRPESSNKCHMAYPAFKQPGEHCRRPL